MHTSRRLAGHDELNLIQFSGHSGLGLIVRMILLATLTTCCDICELCCCSCSCFPSCTLKTHQKNAQVANELLRRYEQEDIQKITCFICKGRE